MMRVVTLFLSIFLSFIFGREAMAADEPPHTIVWRAGNVEIRDYEPMILAEVIVSGDMGRAGNRAFQPLAGYIFGDNTARDGAGSDRIAMTTPVTQTRSQRIEMTTPVTQSAAGEDWRVGFVMPANWSMDTLPVPNDGRIEISQQPARRMIALRFSGGPSESRFMAREAELREITEEAGYSIVGEAVYARYDPPWVPTPFRRNEVMFEITQNTTS